MVSSDKLDLDMLGSVFNHLVLPPEIPGAEDSDVDGVSNNILLRMIHATNTAMDLTHDVPWREEYQSLRDSLQTCLELNRGHLERDSLLKQFKELDYRQVLILYLNEQNAGLLIRRHKKYVFRTSPHPTRYHAIFTEDAFTDTDGQGGRRSRRIRII